MVVAAYEGRWLANSRQSHHGACIADADASAVYSPIFVLDDTGTRRYILSAS